MGCRGSEKPHSINEVFKKFRGKDSGLMVSYEYPSLNPRAPTYLAVMTLVKSGSVNRTWRIWGNRFVGEQTLVGS